MNSKMILLNDDGEKKITIFIHGYSAVKSADELVELTSEINCLQLKGAVYLLCWKSGNWSLPKPIVTTTKIMHTILKGKAVLSPPALVLDLVTWATMEIAKFKSMETRSEKLGRSLLGMIKKIKHSRKYPITLVGHSLGARAIYFGLSEDAWDDVRIQDVIFMGGAVACDVEKEFGESWSDVVREVHGTIYNLYSDDDNVLDLKPLENCVGESPIRERVGKIININTHLGHLSYWPSLEWCFQKVYPNRVRSNYYYGEILQECPYCESIIPIVSDEITECHECGITFGFDQAMDQYFYTDEYPEFIEIECPYCDEEFAIQESADYICPECENEIEIKRVKDKAIITKECDECDGEQEVVCDVCDGDGYLEDEDGDDVECEECEGTGTILCSECDGDGYVLEEQ